MAIPPALMLRPSRREQPQQPDVLWIMFVGFRIILGICLAVLGGIAFGRACTGGGIGMWTFGGITLLAGLGLTLSGIRARYQPPSPHFEPAKEEEEPAPTPEPVVPLLGALLVYKFGFLTHQRLQQALAEQTRSTPRRRLGEILVQDGFITAGQLEEVVAFQHAAFEESETKDEPLANMGS